jgi:hypothetical protein
LRLQAQQTFDKSIEDYMSTPVSFYSSRINDNTIKQNGSAESGTWQVAITTLTAANLTAQETLLAALQSAVDGITLGILAEHTTTVFRDQISAMASNNPLAQRENKWLVRYTGDTLHKKFQMSIPTADLSLLIPHSEFIDLAAGVGLAFKSAFEAIVKSPDDGAETVTVTSVQFVGRNT